MIVHEINGLVVRELPGTEYSYLRISPLRIQLGLMWITSLQRFCALSICPICPLAILTLKVGMPIMPLRKIRPKLGLCNGCRLQITSLRKCSIRSKILAGSFAGKEHSLPRIQIQSGADDLYFRLIRRQYPSRPASPWQLTKPKAVITYSGIRSSYPRICPWPIICCTVAGYWLTEADDITPTVMIGQPIMLFTQKFWRDSNKPCEMWYDFIFYDTNTP